MLDVLELLPPDPLLGLISRYQADQHEHKIDLGVGVYRDDAGETPVLTAVKQAEAYLLQHENSKVYVGPVGNIVFNDGMQKLVFGDQFDELQARCAAIQTPGGCGALRVSAELIMKANSSTTVWLSNPTWANHEPLLGGIGLTLSYYDYYDYSSHTIDFPAMLASLKVAKPGDIVLLHACCHNPSGADLSQEQWQNIIKFCSEKQLIPLIDVAYQGFGEGIDDDAYGIREACRVLPEVFITISCSKNLGLYRERVGVALVVTKTRKAADVVNSHMKSITRRLYSMPPSHGASVVAHILSSAELNALWREELLTMRERIISTRQIVAAKLRKALDSPKFDFIVDQRGMFSFLGITDKDVKRLASDYSIYMADSSRINIAGLNSTNMDYFCASLARIVR